jgi:hypothetical protein
MPIVGDHPESGVRFVFERPLAGGPPWTYRGNAFTPDTAFALEIEVSPAGDVRVTGDHAPAEIAEKVRLLFRTLSRQAKDAPGGQPPRKVVRWRGEK